MPVSDAAIQRASLVALLLVLALGGWLLRKRLQGPESERERDEAHADAKREELRGSDRLRVVSSRPEWWRRVVKKWNAAGRLGSQKLNGSK